MAGRTDTGASQGGGPEGGAPRTDGSPPDPDPDPDPDPPGGPPQRLFLHEHADGLHAEWHLRETLAPVVRLEHRLENYVSDVTKGYHIGEDGEPVYRDEQKAKAAAAAEGRAEGGDAGPEPGGGEPEEGTGPGEAYEGLEGDGEVDRGGHALHPTVGKFFKFLDTAEANSTEEMPMDALQEEGGDEDAETAMEEKELEKEMADLVEIPAKLVAEARKPVPKPAASEAYSHTPGFNATGRLCPMANLRCIRDYCKANKKLGSAVPLKRLGFPLHRGIGGEAATRNVSISEIFVHSTQSNFNARYKRVRANLVPKRAENLVKHLKFDSCAIVGNSGNLLLAEYGKDIDSHDVVIRVNQAPTEGSYEKHVGKKTSMRLLNRLWSAAYASRRMILRHKLPIEKGVILAASRGNDLLSNFVRLKRRFAGRKDVRVALLSSDGVGRARHNLRFFRQCMLAMGRRFRGGGVPSSGLVLIVNMKDICKRLSVYGVGVNKYKGKQPRYQYYRGMLGRSRGNPTHSFDAELAFIRSLAKSNYLRFCDPSGCIGYQ